MDPFGGIGLDKTKSVCNGQLFAERPKKMHMAAIPTAAKRMLFSDRKMPPMYS
jgi:hypothetical protein